VEALEFKVRIKMYSRAHVAMSDIQSSHTQMFIPECQALCHMILISINGG